MYGVRCVSDAVPEMVPVSSVYGYYDGFEYCFFAGQVEKMLLAVWSVSIQGSWSE